ncbi:hypothetical protein OGAPHI_006938 [Ogataea philodendri]|uniref:Uncharacterized protein n=1 Tax=Ogataea philodendri TaxID=1378263 RepID=A0A9P8NVU5_9ASCO|nr:uncharacterized protein OGAPHI_006938 [Ogataea philodendri]KAH3660352.1 hypothetical protein OGAPHI_006938 [Ogataea philodendri]
MCSSENILQDLGVVPDSALGQQHVHKWLINRPDRAVVIHKLLELLECRIRVVWIFGKENRQERVVQRRRHRRVRSALCFVVFPSGEPDLLGFLKILRDFPCVCKIFLDKVQLQRSQVRHALVDSVFEEDISCSDVLTEANERQVCHGHIAFHVDWWLNTFGDESGVNVRAQLLENTQSILSVSLEKTNSDHSNLQLVMKFLMVTFTRLDFFIHVPNFLEIKVPAFD